MSPPPLCTRLRGASTPVNDHKADCCDTFTFKMLRLLLESK